MRYAVIVILVVSALPASECTAEVRIEIGIDGVYPLGDWTRCRVTGLDDVAEDGSIVIVRVGQMFERRMEVLDGTAAGSILIFEEAPLIELEVVGKGRVALRKGALDHLHPVKDELPVIFVGNRIPDETAVKTLLGNRPIHVIRLTTEEFFRQVPVDVGWVRVLALGTMTDDDLKQMKKHLRNVGGRVLIVEERMSAREWLANLPFSTGSVKGYNLELARYLRAPADAFGEEPYNVFGSLGWGETTRRNVGLCFLGSLLVVAVWSIGPGRVGVARLGGISFLVFSTLALVWIADVCASTPIESVSMTETSSPVVATGETIASPGTGVVTTFYSISALRKSNAGLDSRVIPERPDRLVPVAFSRTQWTASKLVVTEDGRLTTEMSVPSRQVFISRRYLGAGVPVEDRFETDGRKVWQWTEDVDLATNRPSKLVGPDGKPVKVELPSSIKEGMSLVDYLALELHPNARVEELRDGMLRYWSNRPGHLGEFRIGWTEAEVAGKHFRAGTAVIVGRHFPTSLGVPNP